MLCHILFICVVGIVVGKQIFVVGNNPVIVILWKDYVVGIMPGSVNAVRNRK